MISIIVPVYKVEHYLHNCINSVLKQSYLKWELILVDDGSPDRCGEICDEYSKIDDRIRVIHKSNGGQAQARNRGLDICRGEYVVFLDSDDFLSSDYLGYLVETADKYKADIVQCDYIRGMQTEFPLVKRKIIEKVFDNHTVFLEDKANVIVWGKLYKRDIVIANRIKEGKFYEDDFTTWKWYYNAKKIVVSNSVLYYYTENPTSTMAQHSRKPSFDFLEAYDERIDFFVQKAEVDLEHCSRLQLCKAIVLTYCNKNISDAERLKLKCVFEENWRVLRTSPYIERKYKLLFGGFHWFPAFASQMVATIHSN